MRNSRPKPSESPTRQSFLKSFLDSGPTWEPTDDPVDTIECIYLRVAEVPNNDSCGVCLQGFTEADKKKLCKFCRMNICKDHLRKRRQMGKVFERICDDCEDRYLFERLKKYQAGAQQAEVVQEQILNLKWQDTVDRLRGRQIKVKSLEAHTTELVMKFQKKHDLVNDEYKIMLEKEKQLALDFTLMEKHEQEQKEKEAKTPRSLEEDVKALQDESDKLNKELIKLQKRRVQMQNSLQRKEKQIQEEYSRWEAAEQAKVVAVKQQKDGCTLF